MLSLKPCPFCGHHPEIKRYVALSLYSSSAVAWTSVSCWRCDVGFAAEDDAVDVAAKWNARPDGALG